MFRDPFLLQVYQIHIHDSLGEIRSGEEKQSLFCTQSSDQSFQQLAKDSEECFPLGVDATRRDMYVDDLMSGASSKTRALEIQQKLLTMMDGAGSSLRKWSSNSPLVLAALPDDMKETSTTLDLDRDQTVKALGVCWNTTRDVFQFKITLDEIHGTKNWTKRKVISEKAKVFDPLGWLAPIIIRAKILIQQLWRLELSCNDDLPVTIQQQWVEFRSIISGIEVLTIPRCISPIQQTSSKLICFCDASEKAYAAVVYTWINNDVGSPVISLISSKTRVAPVKKISLPRLELCGAVLLEHLLKNVKQSLKMDFNETIAYSDSTVVLAWLQEHP